MLLPTESRHRNISVVPKLGTCYRPAMRVIARNTLVAAYTAHPEIKPSLERWYDITKKATWTSTNEVQAAFSNAKVLNGERVRFEIAGGNYRLIAAFDFPRQTTYVKFIGAHAEYEELMH
jgi:mRNA interferase HigB